MKSHIEEQLVRVVKQSIATIAFEVESTESYYVNGKLQVKIISKFDTVIDPDAKMEKIDRRMEEEFPGLNFDSEVTTVPGKAFHVETTVFYA